MSLTKKGRHVVTDARQRINDRQFAQMGGRSITAQAIETSKEWKLVRDAARLRHFPTRFIWCPQCRLRQAVVNVPRSCLREHLTEHLIHRALGTEAVWIQEKHDKWWQAFRVGHAEYYKQEKERKIKNGGRQ